MAPSTKTRQSSQFSTINGHAAGLDIGATFQVEYAAAHIQPMPKSLVQMNVQLHHAVTDITGATGMRIIRAIITGTHAPDTLASYRDVRCAASEETLRAALTGTIAPNTSSPCGRSWNCMTCIRRKLPTVTWKSKSSCGR